MTVISIHQPQYLPYLGFFHKIVQSDIFIVLDDVRFQKNGLQNRNKIKNNSQAGWQWLTVPVRHNFGQLINEVELPDNVNWQRKHWNSIRFNYARAPYFADYAESLEAIYEQEYTSLARLNMDLTLWYLKCLGLEKQIVCASALDVTGEQSERLVNLCQAVGGDTYLSGPGGKEYMDLEIFGVAGIEVQWQAFTHPEYPQVFPETGFASHLSAIDALFACGLATIDFLHA